MYAVTDERVRVPHSTERVAWNPRVLATVPFDEQWHELKKCVRTTAYQTARQLNLGLDLSPDPEFEFASTDVDDATSVLLVRRLRP